MDSLFQRHTEQLRTAVDGLAAQVDRIDTAAHALADTLRTGGRVLVAGNGGSAAEAQHFSGEWLGRLRPGRDRAPMAAIALHADTSAVTAIANDDGFDEVFARQVQAYGRDHDCLVVLSTSGSSPNLVRAVAQARSMQLTTIGLLGGTPRALHAACDHVVAVPSDHIAAIQECHLVLVHLLVERTEDLLDLV